MNLFEDCQIALHSAPWIGDGPHQIGHGTDGKVARRPRLSLTQPQVPISQA